MRIGLTVSAVSSAILLAGCAALQAPPKPVSYACDGGNQFQMTFLPGEAGATIEISRMRFHLRHEPSASGMRYACDVLTFSSRGGVAQLDLQDAPAYRNCRAQP